MNIYKMSTVSNRTSAKKRQLYLTIGFLLFGQIKKIIQSKK